MTNDLATVVGLCWGTLQNVELEVLIDVAGDAGFGAITVNPAQYLRARERGLSDAAIRRRLADAGLSVSSYDALFSWIPGAGVVDGDNDFAVFTQIDPRRAFDMAQALGTDLINVTQAPADGPVSMEVIIDAFAALCEQAESAGVRVCLEFLPFNSIPDLASAAAIVNAVDHPAGGLMFDCWHFARSGSRVEDIALVAPEKYFCVQLDDAPATPVCDDLLEETMEHRLLPGDGAIGVADLVRRIASTGARPRYDVEVYSAALRELPPEHRARSALAAAQKVLRAADIEDCRK